MIFYEHPEYATLKYITTKPQLLKYIQTKDLHNYKYVHFGAMRLYAQYQNQAIFPKVETYDFSLRNGGPIGITDHQSDWLEGKKYHFRENKPSLPRA